MLPSIAIRSLTLMRKFLLALCLASGLGVSLLSGQTTNPVVTFHTTLGDINVELHPATAPNTVSNFLGYVDRGDYAGSFIHRLAPGFVVQGGGYRFVAGNVQQIPQQAPVVNEFHDSNLRGTIAMAKLGNDPNSATNQWFFNLADNSANLDNQNGGFTVFGQVADSQSLAVMDAIAALPITNAGSPFDSLPVINYTAGSAITDSNLVTLSAVTRHPAFVNGEMALSNGVFYLAFPGGAPFGYYSYLTDSHYIYHFDLGYEYLFDAADNKSGAYLYDFKSGGFFYTSPGFPFPYLYDFTLNSVVYYYPDPNNPGRYNTNGARYFYVFNTGTIISK